MLIKALTFFLFFLFSSLSAQEISPTLVVTNRSNSQWVSSIQNRLQVELERFISLQSWQGSTRPKTARLDVRYYLAILSQQDENYQASLMVEVFRPVYGTTYKTSLFRWVDTGITFSYSPGMPLVFNENMLQSNLLASLAFYSYLALGMEADSFELHAGTEAYRKADQLISRAQVLRSGGWEMRRTGTTKYRLVYELLSENGRLLRDWFYAYHRKGIDLLYSEPVDHLSQMEASIGLFNQMDKSIKNLLVYKRWNEVKSAEFERILKMEKL
jgi:hypothetical protein